MSTPARPGPEEARARRRRAAQRRRVARVDVAIGVAAAIVILFATPGLAIAALIALIVLVGCGVSLAVERLARRRRAAADTDERF